MLMPKRTKYRRMHKGRLKGTARRGSTLEFGEYGLQAAGRAWLTARQIEAARIAITRHVKRSGKLWIRVFPDKPLSKKPLETRMGKGKGPPEQWVAVVKPGKVLFELAGVNQSVADEAFRLAGHKLPIPTRLLKREHRHEG